MYRKENEVCGGHVEHPGMGGRRGRWRVRTGDSLGKLKERGHLEILGIDVRLMVRQTFKKWTVKA